jgi:hypothetical protein
VRLYRTAQGTVVGRQADAGRGRTELDVPTEKAKLIDWLNDNLPNPANDNHPAFILGRSDAERGMTTNPYSSPDLRAEWERGHAFAVESGAASLTSFAVRTAGISRTTGKRRK